ncbi:MAG: KamA family radical SAM protein [Deltaproteobacteria bacterium]|nr:KamA family radical SAM protein [Deltaproteobacteria bacterium]
MATEALRRWTRELAATSPSLWRALRRSPDVRAARRRLGRRLAERGSEELPSGGTANYLEAIVARDAVRVLHNLVSPRTVRLAGTDALALLVDVARERWDRVPEDIGAGFFEEFLHLFRGVEHRSGIFRAQVLPDFLRMEGREAAIERSRDLDGLSERVHERVGRYVSGLDEDAVRRRRLNRRRILATLGGSAADWSDWRWQLRHVVRTADGLARLVTLSDEERDSIRLARECGIPFGVTPYYASLLDEGGDRSRDRAVRAQVIPPRSYVEGVARAAGGRGRDLDFMRERDTSPLPLITRRYPMICILKPYNTCPQICVYCQRNWEIDEVMAQDALAPEEDIERAVSWIAGTPAVREVLVTGGDPLALATSRLGRILRGIAAIPHVERIRVGSRTPVTLPFRFGGELLALLEELHRPPRREMCVMTHVEHVYEITPELVEAVQAVRRLGIGVYNQLVLTVENSRRFEAVAVRRLLRLAGVDPYYTFCAKGKDETAAYRVPVARLLQEAKEEARLVPGLVRTDETVFNVPRLGKNYLLRGQHHDVIGFHPDGRRIYEFHPWEKKIRPGETFIFTDVSIRDYLDRLAARGEDPADYESIWYYH